MQELFQLSAFAMSDTLCLVETVGEEIKIKAFRSRPRIVPGYL